jgi:hypothetical protein
MDMVRHEAVTQDRGAPQVGIFLQKEEVDRPVFIVEEDRLPVIPPLGDQMRQSGGNDPSDPRHSDSLHKPVGEVKKGDAPEVIGAELPCRAFIYKFSRTFAFLKRRNVSSYMVFLGPTATISMIVLSEGFV